MKKKYITISTVIFIIFFLCTTFVIITDIRQGRQVTLDLVNYFINSQEYKLNKNDFENEQIEILLKNIDPNFYSNKGLSKGKNKSIALYLVEDLYLKNVEKDISNFRERLLAKHVINYTVSKDLQLNLFLNLVYFGHEIYGFSNAAHFYFNKDFKNLNENEFMALVATIDNPDIYNIMDYPVQNQNRIKLIEKRI
jgi:hypothetical protein